MNAIGGYFELELRDHGTVFHDDAIGLNTGRNSFEYVLLSGERYKMIYVPYYTCDVILQPLKRHGYDFRFYSLDSEMMPRLKGIGANEALMYVNYFGVMNRAVHDVKNRFHNVFIDNSQAFFARPLKSVSTFYSPRKFFGLPDGGFAYPSGKLNMDLERDKSIDRLQHLLKRIEDNPESAFDLFRSNEAKLDNLPMRRMSSLTERLLRNIDFKQSLRRRNENFLFLHGNLKRLNAFAGIIDDEKINGPMVYPLLRKGNRKLRKKLIRKKIYVATYWKNVYDQVPKKSWEYYLAENLIPIPIDQRYSIDEMKAILSEIS